MVVSELLKLWDKNEILISLEYLLGKKRSEILLNPNEEIDEITLEKILKIIEKRKESYPLQYLIGKWAFYDFEVFVEPGVLIPRPETELLVEEAINSIEDGSRVLEIGSGTGIISIALARHKNAKVTAIDINKEAIELAKKNAAYNDVEIDFRLGDLFEPILKDESFDLIISNPPYIREDEKKKLEKELEFEPDNALFSGDDGLDLIRKIVKESPKYLNDNGIVLLEFGYDQGEAVNDLFKEAGFRGIIIKKDYNGHDRIGKGFKCY